MTDKSQKFDIVNEINFGNTHQMMVQDSFGPPKQINIQPAGIKIHNFCLDGGEMEAQKGDQEPTLLPTMVTLNPIKVTTPAFLQLEDPILELPEVAIQTQATFSPLEQAKQDPKQQTETDLNVYKQSSLDKQFAAALNLQDLDIEDDDLIKPVPAKTTLTGSVRTTQPTHSDSGPRLTKTRSEAPFFSTQLTARQSMLPESNTLDSFCTFNTASQAQAKIQNLLFENQQLRTLLETSQSELRDLRQFLRKSFKSRELLVNQHLDQRSLQALAKCFQDKPLVALTFASPLVRRLEQVETDTLETHEMTLLDYNKEFQGAIKGLNQTGNAIQVKRVHATLHKFTLCLTENPVGLHFSGHGIENSVKTVGKQNYFLHNQGNCLVFETENGVAHFISEKQLKALLESSGGSLKFVFIASCHSEFAGEIFHNAGVEHVICVQQGQEILDEAAITFAKIFYQLLFGEKMTICQAFQLSKDMLSSSADNVIASEAKKFILKIKESRSWRKQHECGVLGPYPQGTVEDQTSQPFFPFETAKVDEFVGRQRELQEIVECVLQNRLTTVVGLPGIGKTTICKCTGFFLFERSIFKDGVTYFSLRAKDQTTVFILQLYLFLQKIYTQYKEQQKNGRKSFVEEHKQHSSSGITMSTSQTVSAQTIEKDQLQLDYSAMEQKIYEYLQHRELLIVIDNAENCLRKDGEKFRAFLQSLFENCVGVRLLVTSRDQIQNLGDITEKVYQLKELSNYYTVQLLEKKSLREFSQPEIDELLSTKMKKNQMMLYDTPKTRKEKNKILRLEDHHLCTLLGGHPHAISLIAPLLQSRTLLEMYKMLHSMMTSKRFMQNLHDLNPVASLKVSLDASIEQMRREKNGEALELFYLLGFLPGGISESDLQLLWPNDDWPILAELLRKASLLVEKVSGGFSGETRGQTKYQLLPFMNKYAESLLSSYQFLQYHSRCSDYFLRICKQIYEDLNVEHKRAIQQKLHLYLMDHETNIWSCIYRICDLSAQKSADEKRVDLQFQNNYNNVCYSSTDEYEAFLIGEYTTDGDNASAQFSTQDVSDKSMMKFGRHSSKNILMEKYQQRMESSESSELAQPAIALTTSSNLPETSDLSSNKFQTESNSHKTEKSSKLEIKKSRSLKKRLNDSSIQNIDEVDNEQSFSAFSNNEDDGGSSLDLAKLSKKVSQHSHRSSKSRKHRGKEKRSSTNRKKSVRFKANNDHSGSDGSNESNQSEEGRYNKQNTSMTHSSQSDNQSLGLNFKLGKIKSSKSAYHADPKLAAIDELYNSDSEIISDEKLKEILDTEENPNEGDNQGTSSNRQSTSPIGSFNPIAQDLNQAQSFISNKHSDIAFQKNTIVRSQTHQQLRHRSLINSDIYGYNKSQDEINDGTELQVIRKRSSTFEGHKSEAPSGFVVTPHGSQQLNLWQPTQSEQLQSQIRPKSAAVVRKAQATGQGGHRKRGKELPISQETKSLQLNKNYALTDERSKSALVTSSLEITQNTQQTDQTKVDILVQDLSDSENKVVDSNNQKSNIKQAVAVKPISAPGTHLTPYAPFDLQSNALLKQKAGKKLKFQGEKCDSDDSEELLTQGSRNRLSNLKRKQFTANKQTFTQQLDPIQEDPGQMSLDGKLLVYFVSCNILRKNYTDALRAIHLIQEYRVADYVCQANLLKLQGLALMARPDKTKDALKCYELANRKFAKIGNKRTANLGVAQCSAAEGYLLLNRAVYFLDKEGSDEGKVLAKASERFELARQVYKMREHLAGQAYCSKQLGVINRKQKLPYLHLSKEQKELQKRQRKIEDTWIYRYDGWEISLFIEPIDKPQIMSNEQVITRKAALTSTKQRLTEAIYHHQSVTNLQSTKTTGAQSVSPRGYSGNYQPPRQVATAKERQSLFRKPRQQLKSSDSQTGTITGTVSDAALSASNLNQHLAVKADPADDRSELNFESQVAQDHTAEQKGKRPDHAKQSKLQELAMKGIEKSKQKAERIERRRRQQQVKDSTVGLGIIKHDHKKSIVTSQSLNFTDRDVSPAQSSNKTQKDFQNVVPKLEMKKVSKDITEQRSDMPSNSDRTHNMTAHDFDNVQEQISSQQYIRYGSMREPKSTHQTHVDPQQQANQTDKVGQNFENQLQRFQLEGLPATRQSSTLYAHGEAGMRKTSYQGSPTASQASSLAKAMKPHGRILQRAPTVQITSASKGKKASQEPPSASDLSMISAEPRGSVKKPRNPYAHVTSKIKNWITSQRNTTKNDTAATSNGVSTPEKTSVGKGSGEKPQENKQVGENKPKEEGNPFELAKDAEPFLPPYLDYDGEGVEEPQMASPARSSVLSRSSISSSQFKPKK